MGNMGSNMGKVQLYVSSAAKITMKGSGDKVVLRTEDGGSITFSSTGKMTFFYEKGEVLH